MRGLVLFALPLTLPFLGQIPTRSAPPLPPQTQKLIERLDGGAVYTERDAAMEVAKTFFDGVLHSNIQNIRMSLGESGYIEGKHYATPDAYTKAWLELVAAQEERPYQLNGIELFTPAQMEARYGKPPERLKDVPWKARDGYIAVANLSGRATILVLARTAPGIFKVVAFSD